MHQLFQELKRRNVYKGTATYAVVAFITLQPAKLIFPATTLEGGYDVLVRVAFVGLPIALVIAWAFELTREDAPELHGQPFVHTFMYGNVDGELAFLEPMITCDSSPPAPITSSRWRRPSSTGIPDTIPRGSGSDTTRRRRSPAR